MIIYQHIHNYCYSPIYSPAIDTFVATATKTLSTAFTTPPSSLSANIVARHISSPTTPSISETACIYTQGQISNFRNC